MPRLRVATWNINSLRLRHPLLDKLREALDPDVICLQETKVTDAAFPALAFQALGYDHAHHGGAGRWNGVAILSRVGLEEVATGMDDDPEAESRFIAATCGGLRVCSVYVPNGREVGTEHYEAKLAWLAQLRTYLDANVDPASDTIICGDFNIAPEDRDIYDPSKFKGATHVSQAERDSLARIMEWGLVDVFRRCQPQEKLFTWWDYRAGDFHNHRGMRIDLALATPSLAERAAMALIDRNARKGKLPSDHAPLFVDFVEEAR
jgi:exodeoxyribonuclease III